MIDKKALGQFIEERLDGDYFLVDIRVSKSNEITVEIDSDSGVDIDYCIALSRAIEEAFPRDPEDYELEVGSAGLTSPFKVKRQYEKNIGNDVEVLSRDGHKYIGRLERVDDNGFAITTTVKEKPEGAKRAVSREVEMEFNFNDVNSVKYEFIF